MLTALLPTGKIVHATEYSEAKHGFSLFCIDPQCKAPVIFVGPSAAGENKRSAYFKTIGNSDSRHTENCGFFEPLDVVEAIEKTAVYQKQMLDAEGVPKQVINLNLRRLDPDYVAKEPVERKEKTPDKEDKVKVKDDKEAPGTIGSLKSIVKLLTSYEPDLLATIVFNVGGGRKMPLSSVLLSHERAYDMLWQDQTIPRLQYFVHGKVREVTRLDRVMYIDLEHDDEDKPFTIVIFSDYFKHFHYDKSDLIGKYFLVFGELRKNNFKDKNKAQILIKSSSYMEPIRFKKKHIIM